MFAQQLNQLRLDLSITPRGPLLIRAGRKSVDPTRPDLECVRTTIDRRPTVYIPGSSLKGVMRSHAERLLLSEQIQVTPTFDERARTALKQDASGPDAYKHTSPLGRTFGNLSLKSRVAVADLLPGGFEEPASAERERLIDLANATEQRNGVGIDRLMGSARRGALFDQEVVVAGRFDGRILLRNVQLYQLALVLLVLRDMEAGFVQLGSGTSRGNGWVGVEIRELVIETRAGRAPSNLLAGIGMLASSDAGYDLFGNDQVRLPAGVEAKRRLVWDQITIRSQDAIDSLATNLIDGPWTTFLDKAKGQQWRA
jgi:CRISPR-associated RAMP protein (TIGR02581 family)